MESVPELSMDKTAKSKVIMNKDQLLLFMDNLRNGDSRRDSMYKKPPSVEIESDLELSMGKTYEEAFLALEVKLKAIGDEATKMMVDELVDLDLESYLH